MKALYSWIAALTLVALVSTIALIPTKEEIAFIALKSQNYSQAKTYYDEEYKKGNHSLDVILMLSIINEKEGNLNQSIFLMNEYIQDNPQDTLALRRLADIYRNNQDYDSYFRTLLELRSKNNDKEILLDLVNEYPRVNRNQISLYSILEQLVKTDYAREGDYLQLAYLYAADKKYKEAVSLLEKRRLLLTKKENFNDILFEFWLDIEIGKMEGKQKEFSEKGLKVLVKYLKKKNDPKLSYYTFGIVKELTSEDPELMHEFISEIHSGINKNTALEVELFQYHFDNSSYDKNLLQRIFILQKNTPSNIRLQNLVFTIFLNSNEDDRLIEFLKTIHAENIEQSFIIDLAIACIERHTPKLAEEMEKSLGVTYLQRYPIIAFALAVASENQNYEDYLNKFLSDSSLTQTDLYHLLRITAAAELEAEAMVFGEKLSPYTVMDDFKLMNIARAYMQIHQERWLYSSLENASTTIGQKNTEIALSLLDISVGKSKKVAEWLYQQKKVKAYVLDAMYTVAEEKKEYPLALYLSKRRLKEYPTPLALANYALALAQIGKEEQAISVLKKLYEEDTDNIAIERRYLSVLVIAAKRNSSQEKVLLEFIESRESQQSLPLDLEQDFAYAYLDVLQDFSKAEHIFWKRAQNVSPQNTAVQSLIYLWGPNPSPEKIKWLEDKANQSNSKELGYWLEDLNYVGRYEDVIVIFQKRMGEKLDSTTYFAYMEALNHKKYKKQLHEAIDLALPKMHAKKDLKRLSIYAQAAEYPTAVKEIWEKIAKTWPTNPESWQGLAKVAFEQGDYSFAKICIHKFFSLCCPSITSIMLTAQYREAEAFWECLQTSHCLKNDRLYETFYQYGMIVKKEFKSQDAKDFFHLTLQVIGKIKEKSFQMQEYQALALYHLGERNQGIRLLYTLYQLSSHDPNIGADYLNILMNEGQLRTVREFLQDSSNYGKILHECHATFESQQ